jgi:hypothetical protein
LKSAFQSKYKIMQTIKHKYLIFALLLCSTTAVIAQKNLPTESVDVVKDFDARLLESNKIRVAPTLPPLDTTTKFQTYSVPPRPLAVSYDAPKLRPIGMKTAGKEKIYNGFVKAGGGIPSAIYAEGGYYYAKPDKFDAKLWGRHHSMNNRQIENQRFRNTDIGITSNIFLKNNLAAEAKVGVTSDRVHYYGYNRDSFSVDAEGVRQNFNIIELGGRLYNKERTSTDLNFYVAPNFYRMTDYYSNSETGLDLRFGAEKWFAEKHLLKIGIRTDLTSYNDLESQKLNNIYLQPSFTYHFDFMKIKVGGNFASNRDIFYIFPDAELTLRIIGDGVQVFAAANGDLRKNTYRSIAEYNPFIQMRGSEIRNTQVRNYFGGIRGNLGWLDYSAQVGYAQARDLALFQTRFDRIDRINFTRFRVVYDTANIFNLQGTIKLTPIKNLTVTGTLSQNVFTMSNEAAAWGLPGLEGNFGAQYSLLEGKALVKADIYIADRINRLDEFRVAGKDGALLDFNLGGQYFFSKQVGAFLQINNLFNNRRERWYNYPIYGANVLVGVTAKF